MAVKVWWLQQERFNLFLLLFFSLFNYLGKVFICAKAEKELQQIYNRLVENLEKRLLDGKLIVLIMFSTVFK